MVDISWGDVVSAVLRDWRLAVFPKNRGVAAALPRSRSVGGHARRSGIPGFLARRQSGGLRGIGWQKFGNLHYHHRWGEAAAAGRGRQCELVTGWQASRVCALAVCKHVKY